jgi:calcineurin-like phosphoesterase family protein
MTVTVSAERLFFTADTHFYHKNINYIMKRPYSSMEEMIETMILLWNTTVPKDGTVFHLGDVSFGNTTNTVSVLGQLNGKIHLIKGNHDHGMSATVREIFTTTSDYTELLVNEGGGTKQRISLMHYPLRVWNHSHYGAWNLHGHSHGSLEPIGKQLDVGVDCCAYKPISYHDIKKYMDASSIVNQDHHKVRIHEMA